MRKVPYPSPGEILLEEFLKPMGITQYRLAKEIGVPQRRIGDMWPAVICQLPSQLTRPLGRAAHGETPRSAAVSGEIVAGTRAITPDTGLRLSRFFAMSDGFWIGLQADFDREKVRATLAKTLARIKPWPEAVRAFEYGRSAQGRPLLALLVSRAGSLEPVELRRRRVPLLMLQAGIHPGESDGKDAGFIALRELLNGEVAGGVLEGQPAAGDRGGHEERAGLDAVGYHRVIGPTQPAAAVDLDHVL